jgi:hypothetical protein
MESKKIKKSRTEYNRLWREKNKERHNACKRKWQLEHREYLNKWHREWRKKNHERLRQIEKRRYEKHKIKRCMQQRKRHAERRLKILEHYGRRCICCGETQIEFLSIDHVNGGGYKERKDRGIFGLYQYIIKNNYPDRFRILCHNCNQSMGFYGYCPHNKENE